MKKILITGGAGYLGSHLAKQLKNMGNTIHIIDIKLPHHPFWDKFYHLDIRDDLSKVFELTDYDIVYHFAGRIEVELSNIESEEFRSVNVGGTINILTHMKKYNVKNIVFASTAAVYQSSDSPLSELSPIHTSSVYGETKVLCEDAIKKSDIKYVIFRFFNLAGADKSGIIGENHNPETHLIPNIIRNPDKFSVYGNTYNTPDGTCVRDYVHVNDVARACVYAMKHLLKLNYPATLNLGSGTGNSVLEVIKSVEKEIKSKIKYTIKDKRDGDPAYLVAKIDLAEIVLYWKPEYTLQDIIKDAVYYENRLTKY